MNSIAESNIASGLIENNLRDFYNYLKSVQTEQLSSSLIGGCGGEIHEGRDEPANVGNRAASSSTSASCHFNNAGCYDRPNDNNGKFYLRSQHKWDNKGTKSYLKQLKRFGNMLKKQRENFPTDHDNKLVLDIVTMIQLAINDGAENTSSDVARKSVAPLLDLVSQLWNSVQVIDLDLLLDLLHKNRMAGEAIEDQDVVMFCGAAGSGKTTTLHYLAGTMFEETEVDGFQHIQPKCVADPILATYETSNGRDTITRTLQTAQIEYHGHTLVLCDTPSLNDAEGYEENIAHGLGLVRALQKAKSVRPVLVISRDSIGSRSGDSIFSETLSSLTDLMSNGADDMDFTPFQYVFTKYEEKHKTSIHKQFQAIWKHPHAEPGKTRMVRSCIDCILKQTTPYANIVLPLGQKPVELLNTLVLPTQPVIHDPHDKFRYFASTEALERLDIQLQITLGDMTKALLRSDYTIALHRLKQMKQLAELLPEAGEYAKLGESAMLRHAIVLQEQATATLRLEDYDLVIEKLRALYKFAQEVPEASASAQHGLELAVKHVIKPRENILHTLEELQVAVDDNEFTRLLLQLKKDILGVLKSEALREEIRGIQERILYSDPSNVGTSELMNLPCMPQRSGEAFCEDQVSSLTDMILADVPHFEENWAKMDTLVKNRSVFLVALARLKEIGTRLRKLPGGDKAEEVCDTAFEKFYEVVDRVLTRENITCRSTEDLKLFEHQAWFLILLKEASEVYENSLEGARSFLQYQQAFQKFYGAIEHILSNAEKNFLASANDLEAFERQARFLGLLRDISETLQNSPGSARAASTYEQAFTLFYAVVASVLSEAEKSFQSKDQSIPALEKKARFLALLQNVSAILRNSPGSERAVKAYKHSFGRFIASLGSILKNVEQNYLSDVQDWDEIESTCWFLALLIQGKLNFKPELGSKEERQLKELEQRLLTLMLRTELELMDTMKLIQEKKILSFVKKSGNDKDEIMTDIQFLNLTELDTRRKLLMSLFEKPKVRKLLPSMIEPSEITEALSNLDKQLVKFFAGQVLNAVQEYNMVVELQKKGKKLLATKQIAVSLRSNIVLAKEDFAVVRSWSPELAGRTESNWRRLGALKKCVELGISKLDKMIAKDQSAYNFSCGVPGTTVFQAMCR